MNYVILEVIAVQKALVQLNPNTSLPVSVAGGHDCTDIANAFQRHFKVNVGVARMNYVLHSNPRKYIPQL